MKTRRVQITGGVSGRKIGATLMLCPMCSNETFVAYFPDGVDHSHFQCTNCGVCYCDGCQGDDRENTPGNM